MRNWQRNKALVFYVIVVVGAEYLQKKEPIFKSSFPNSDKKIYVLNQRKVDLLSKLGQKNTTGIIGDSNADSTETPNDKVEFRAHLINNSILRKSGKKNTTGIIEERNADPTKTPNDKVEFRAHLINNSILKKSGKKNYSGIIEERNVDPTIAPNDKVEFRAPLINTEISEIDYMGNRKLLNHESNSEKIINNDNSLNNQDLPNVEKSVYSDENDSEVDDNISNRDDATSTEKIDSDNRRSGKTSLYHEGPMKNNFRTADFVDEENLDKSASHQSFIEMKTRDATEDAFDNDEDHIEVNDQERTALAHYESVQISRPFDYPRFIRKFVYPVIVPTLAGPRVVFNTVLGNLNVPSPIYLNPPPGRLLGDLNPHLQRTREESLALYGVKEQENQNQHFQDSDTYPYVPPEKHDMQLLSKLVKATQNVNPLNRINLD